MDLITYLEALPPVKLSRLYDSPFTCLAVLRSLPPLAKQYTLRLLFLDSGVPQGELLDHFPAAAGPMPLNAALGATAQA
jgi:transcription initiation factor TFIIH subunit 4